MNKERLEQKLKELQTELNKLQNTAFAISGAIQFCQQLIAEIDKPVAENSDGIPLEQLFPGATIEGASAPSVKE